MHADTCILCGNLFRSLYVLVGTVLICGEARPAIVLRPYYKYTRYRPRRAPARDEGNERYGAWANRLIGMVEVCARRTGEAVVSIS